jgi:hypothetical protein
MYTQIGACPKCGAPIYTYSVWHAITPPPSFPTCCCNPGLVDIHTYTTSKVYLNSNEDASGDYVELSEIEKRIVAMYRERISAEDKEILAGTMRCPDCKHRMAAFSYYCSVCGWEDKERREEERKRYERSCSATLTDGILGNVYTK